MDDAAFARALQDEEERAAGRGARVAPPSPEAYDEAFARALQAEEDAAAAVLVAKEAASSPADLGRPGSSSHAAPKGDDITASPGGTGLRPPLGTSCAGASESPAVVEVDLTKDDADTELNPVWQIAKGEAKPLRTSTSAPTSAILPGSGVSGGAGKLASVGRATAAAHAALALTGPEAELLDPTPNIFALFAAANERFFSGKLVACEVKWSARMTLCAGVCSFEGYGGLCSIRLSKPLLSLRPRSDLINTLLHEMIHAYLFVTGGNQDRDGHGPDFQYHAIRINSELGCNITIYHTFHDEVEAQRGHHWQCNGPCRGWKPFFGIVKRASNRPPGPRDPWYERHRRTCGGTWTKIREPEGYRSKASKRRRDDDSAGADSGAGVGAGGAGPHPRLEDFFGGRRNGEPAKAAKAPVMPSTSQPTSIVDPLKRRADPRRDTAVCPYCRRDSIPTSQIEAHLKWCSTTGERLRAKRRAS